MSHTLADTATIAQDIATPGVIKLNIPATAPLVGATLALGGATLGSYAQSNLGQSLLTASTATDVPLLIKGAASQSANLQEWRNSSGTLIGYFSAGATLTASTIATSALSTLTAGFQDTIYAANSGTPITSGTFTPAIASGNEQSVTNNCTTSWTFAPPTVASGQRVRMCVTVTNNSTGTLVAPTVSGFTKTNTSAYATTNSTGDGKTGIYDFYILADDSTYSSLTVVARA